MKGKKDFSLEKTFAKNEPKEANPEGKTQDGAISVEETEEDVRKGLEKLRKVTSIEYTTMKVKKQVHRSLKRVARKEKVNAVDLLDHIIEEWLSKYEQVKS